MAQDKSASPFSALTYQEQQDRWREWRSRQLEYQSAVQDPPPVQAPKQEELPPLKLPMAAQRPAPTRHNELDKLKAKHLMAARKAGAWQSTSDSVKSTLE